MVNFCLTASSGGFNTSIIWEKTLLHSTVWRNNLVQAILVNMKKQEVLDRLEQVMSITQTEVFLTNISNF